MELLNSVPFRFLLLLFIMLSSYSYLLFFCFHSIDCFPYFYCCYYFPINPSFCYYFLKFLVNYLPYFFFLCILGLYSLNILSLFSSFWPWLFSIRCGFCSFICFKFPFYLSFDSTTFYIFAALISFSVSKMCSFRIFTLCNSMWFSSLFLAVFSSILSFFLFCWIFRMSFLVSFLFFFFNFYLLYSKSLLEALLKFSLEVTSSLIFCLFVFLELLFDTSYILFL